VSDANTTSAASTRFDVRSPDGTDLAVWVAGQGRALVLVHGSPSNHSTFDPLVHALGGELTTFAMDRRGSGASGDTEPYSVDREFEDVAAVVDAVADHTGGAVALFGHSYGCNPAMGAATLTTNVHHLILYEPSFGLDYPAGSIEAIEAAMAKGDEEGAVRAALVDTGAMTDDDFEDFKTSPRWASVVAAVPTLARECRVEQTWDYQPGRFDAITASALLLTGSDSDPAITELTRRAAAAITGSTIRVLDGHAHFAYKTDPGMVATLIRTWINT
jgi:pimeloyl-ACP methyl ester carboxylesterase